MRAGELDQRVTLERFGEYKDASGAWTEGWETVGTFWAAVLLLNLPSLMDALSMTVFNQTSEQSLGYSPPSSPGAIYIQFAVYAIQIVGVIGIARGVCLLRDTPNQAMNFSRGIVHLFGGTLAVNLVSFLRGIGATVGGDVQTYVAKIIG